MIKEIYAIGTKALVGEKVILIIGRIQKIDDDSFHDYVGVACPSGFQSEQELVYFSEQEIKKIVELGYVDDQEIEQINQIKETLGV